MVPWLMRGFPEGWAELRYLGTFLLYLPTLWVLLGRIRIEGNTIGVWILRVVVDLWLGFAISVMVMFYGPYDSDFTVWGFIFNGISLVVGCVVAGVLGSQTEPVTVQWRRALPSAIIAASFSIYWNVKLG